MRNTIFDALKLSPTSSNAEVQSAIRRILRRFWAFPRSNSGDTEEAVRFSGMTTSILLHPVRRQQYENAIRELRGLPVVAVAEVVHPEAVDEFSIVDPISASLFEEDVTPASISTAFRPERYMPGVDALGQEWPVRTARGDRRIPLVLMLACFTLWLTGAYMAARGALPTAVEHWVALSTLIFVGATCILVAPVALAAIHVSPVLPAASNLSKLIITKWRRESSVFIGMPLPKQDPAWVFQVKLMELTRSSGGYVTVYHRARRLTARLFDYAIIALPVLWLSMGLTWLWPATTEVVAVLRSPVILPVIVVMLTAVIESHHIHSFGKAVMGLYPLLGVTRPQDVPEPTTIQLIARRAWAVAKQGGAFGFWPFAMWRWRAYWREMSEGETPWDEAGDSIVLGRPILFCPIYTALLLIVSTALLCMVLWWSDTMTWYALLSG